MNAKGVTVLKYMYETKTLYITRTKLNTTKQISFQKNSRSSAT